MEARSRAEVPTFFSVYLRCPTPVMNLREFPSEHFITAAPVLTMSDTCFLSLHRNNLQHLRVDAGSSTRELVKTACVYRRREQEGRLEFQGYAPMCQCKQSWQRTQTYGYQVTEEPRHGRTAQVSARHVDQPTRTADHPTTAE